MLVKKYAQRWLLEVDFDLTLSLLAHNLYRILAKALPGFERCTAETIYRKFLANGAQIQIKNNYAIIRLKKKTHLPILLNIPWINRTTALPWINVKIHYEGWTIN